jgi:hypothetical protein
MEDHAERAATDPDVASPNAAREAMTELHDLPAGGFSTWLRATRCALAQEGAANVPCGACTACCTSSYFIHVGPTDTRTLARIPAELLFAAPRSAGGALLLGYDKRGHCPMLVDGKCSIYEDRPLTCRGYDCRVFAAAGIAADRDAITQQARRWVFGYPTDDDRDQHAAVRAAARFLRERAACFPGGVVPESPAQVAVLAIKVYEVFLENGVETGRTGRRSDARLAAAVVKVNDEFGAG